MKNWPWLKIILGLALVYVLYGIWQKIVAILNAPENFGKSIWQALTSLFSSGPPLPPVVQPNLSTDPSLRATEFEIIARDEANPLAPPSSGP